jgi:hypothetical protein
LQSSSTSSAPLELIIWENIVYLANDTRRAEAFAILKRTIGTHPDQILAAQHSALAQEDSQVPRHNKDLLRH